MLVRGPPIFPEFSPFPGSDLPQSSSATNFTDSLNLCIYRIKMQRIFSTSSDDCLLGHLSINGMIMFEHIFRGSVYYRQSLYDIFSLQRLFQSTALEMERFLISLSFELRRYKLDTDIVKGNNIEAD